MIQLRLSKKLFFSHQLWMSGAGPTTKPDVDEPDLILFKMSYITGSGAPSKTEHTKWCDSI